MREAGFGDLRGPQPTLDPIAAQAQQCWLFCAGWAPERWPVFDAFYPVADWYLLIDLMTTIRNALEK